MNKLRFYLLALAALFVFSVRADEGMWLLQLMQQQHSIDMMKKQGLKLEAQDLYNPNGVSLQRCRRYIRRWMYRRNYLTRRFDSDQSPLWLRFHPAT